MHSWSRHRAGRRRSLALLLLTPTALSASYADVCATFTSCQGCLANLACAWCLQRARGQPPGCSPLVGAIAGDCAGIVHGSPSECHGLDHLLAFLGDPPSQVIRRPRQGELVGAEVAVALDRDGRDESQAELCLRLAARGGTVSSACADGEAAPIMLNLPALGPHVLHMTGGGAVLFDRAPSSWLEASAVLLPDTERFLTFGVHSDLVSSMVRISASLRPTILGAGDAVAVAADTAPIPKLLHHIWMQGFPNLVHLESLGVEPAASFRRWRRGCLDLHPETSGWTYQFWDEASLLRLVRTDPLLMWIRPIYEALDTLIKRVDLAKYLILFRFGGVYLDMDFECLKPIDALIEPASLVVAKEEEDGHRLVAGTPLAWAASNAFIGSRRGHPLWWWAAHEVARRHAIDASMHVLKATGPVLLTQTIDVYRTVNPEVEISIYPKRFFYPMNITGRAWETRHTCARRQGKKGEASSHGRCDTMEYPDAYAIHHFAQSWLEEYEEHFFSRQANRVHVEPENENNMC